MFEGMQSAEEKTEVNRYKRQIGAAQSEISKANKEKEILKKTIEKS